MKLEDGDFLIVVSSDSPTTILEDYANRWEIETLFGCLKTRGFRFEDTHLSEGERINKLVALLALAFTWAFSPGSGWLNTSRSILKNSTATLKSLFRHGFDFLRNVILNLYEKFADFQLVVRFLSCT